MGRWRRLGFGLARGVVGAVVVLLLLVVGGLALLQTGWAKDQLRGLIVRQANNYLTATLSIGSLSGSLLRGIELGDIRLSRGSETLVSIEQVALSYSIRELISGGTLIRSLTLNKPRIVAARQSDGRWDLAALVRRETRRNESTGPRRSIRIERIEVHDGTVLLRDPLSFGAAHVPASFEHLETSLSFTYQPVTWTLDFARASFVGTAPDLTVKELTGTLSNGDAGWEFRALRVVTPRSGFTLNGRIDRRQTPTTLDLHVSAPRFAFQEWAGILRGLGNIAVEASFDTQLTGPPSAMGTVITLHSNGGNVSGDLVIDSSVPGWHAKGAAKVQRLDLARWLNRRDRPSDITGDVDMRRGQSPFVIAVNSRGNSVTSVVELLDPASWQPSKYRRPGRRPRH